MIVVYTSSRGWDHTIRVLPILNELFNYRIEIVSTVPEYLIRSGLIKFRYRSFTVRNTTTDPGYLQPDPFTIDLPGTVSAWKDIISSEPKLLKAEVSRLRSQHVCLIISDISYFGQLVAEQLKVPSVCIATFDWPFIFQNYRGSDSELDSILDHISQISAHFSYCLIPGRPSPTLQIGHERLNFDWVSRKPQLSRTAMRQKLQLSIYQDAILLAFGDQTIKAIPDGIWKRFYETDFFVVIPKAAIWTPVSNNLHLLPSEEWSKFHVDIVNTVDIVIGKLEYSLVSEALHCKTRFLAVERKSNPECEVLQKALAPVVPYREITYEQFKEGDWYVIHELIEVERRPDEFAECSTTGEVEIARWIRKLLGHKEPRYFDPRKLVGHIPIFIVIVAIVVYLLKK